MKLLWQICAGLLFLCAAAMVAQVTKRYAASRDEAQRRGPIAVLNSSHYAAVGNRVGPRTAPLTVVAFVDYECPFSRLLSQRLKALREELPAKLAVVYRNFPLRGHRYAFRAAVASTCAADQGRFLAFHDALTLAGPSALGQRPWTAFAVEAGVPDTVSFSKCLVSDKATNAVTADTLDGHTLDIATTPTFLVNDAKYVGITTDFDAIIRAAVNAR